MFYNSSVKKKRMHLEWIGLPKGFLGFFKVIKNDIHNLFNSRSGSIKFHTRFLIFRKCIGLLFPIKECLEIILSPWRKK